MYRLHDIVYHYEYGKGTIVDICYQDGYPIKVQFTFALVEFLMDGRRRTSDTHSTLSLRPYNLVDGGFSQKRPLPKLKKGDVVYVCFRNIWFVRIFSHFNIEEELCYFEMGKLGNGNIKIAEKWSLENPLKYQE